MIALTGGGTGGHLTIVKNLKQELKSQKIPFIYIGSKNGQDQAWFAQDSDFEAVYFLPSLGFSNGIVRKIRALFFLLKSLLTTRTIFKKHSITQVISVGGYSSAPSSIVAIVSCIPLHIHEQNSVLGRLNRLCKPFAKQIYCSFDLGDNERFAYPVKDTFFTHARTRTQIKTVLFLGGSAGAKFINEFALLVAQELQEHNISIIHQCGEKELQSVQTAYETMGIKADVFSFSKELEKKMQLADVAISRSGATTLWESVSNALPSIFIPYPYAIFDHQFHNANFLASKDLAYIIRQEQCNKKHFFHTLNLLNTNISNISVKLPLLNSHEGAKQIINHITKVAP